MSAPSVKVVLAPGNGVTRNIKRCMWYGWMKQELQARNIPCVISVYPDPITARETIWLPFMRDELHVDSNTIVVGHSSGAAAALRLMETSKIAGCVLVSAYYTDLGDATERASGYFARPWNWEAMKQNAGFIVQFHSANDHLVPVEQGRQVHEWLGTEYFEHRKDGHFQADEFPALIEAITTKVAQMVSQ
eukprot:TRINITY_DN12833_c0_g1_i1.p1 TRINITY_DN12833_c0_g1~~TRINITY_DN12833_c0_g1_i1.p1  ORF type:complete len:190 (+),score=44.42 TRINITY_DN12833_c0_g1_i1:84-653(+)